MRLLFVIVLAMLSGCVSNVSPENDGIPRRPSWAGNS